MDAAEVTRSKCSGAVNAPQVRLGGLVMNDNAEPDYPEYARDPANGFRSMALPLKGSTQLSVRVDQVHPIAGRTDP